MKYIFLLAILLLLELSLSAAVVDVVTNGNFSSGWTGWTTDPKWTIGCAGGCAGSSYASTVTSNSTCIYAYQNVNDVIEQTVTIPANATSAVLSFKVRAIAFNSTNNGNQFSVLFNGTTIYSSTAGSLASSSCFTVSSISVSVPNSSTPQTRTLTFKVNTSGANGSGTWSKFYLDDVVLDVTYNPCSTPSVYIGSASSVICPSGTTLTANSSNCPTCTYSWSTPSGSNSGSSIIAYSSGTYSVTATNSACSMSGSASNYIPSASTPPVPNITIQSWNTCKTEATLSISNYNSNYYYDWSSNVTPTSATTATVSVGASPVTVTIDAEEQNCGLTSNKTFVVNPVSTGSITATLSSTGKALCASANTNNTDQLKAIVTPAGIPCHFLWSTNPPVNGSDSIVTINQSGNYSVIVTNLCDTNQKSYDSKTINTLTNSFVTTSFTPDSLACNNSSTTISVTSNHGTPATYSWNGGCNTASCVITGVGAHSVTVTNACGVINSQQGILIPIKTSNIITPRFTPATLSVCGTNHKPLAIALLSQCSGCNYTWIGSNITNASGTTNTITGAGLVKVIAMNACGDTASSTIIVTNDPSAIISASDTQICVGDTITLTASTGSGYNWNNSQTTQNIKVMNSGIYTVTVANPFGCTSSASTNITINKKKKITVDAGQDTTVTKGSVFTLGGSPTATKGTGTYFYNWSGNVSSATVPNPTATITNQYTYKVTVTDGTNCASYDSVTVKPAKIDCDSFKLNKYSKIFDYDGGRDTIQVTASDFCNWTTLNSDPTMVTLLNGYNGTGNIPNIVYKIEPCPSKINRSTTLTIQGKIYSISQNCACSLTGVLNHTVDSCKIIAQDIPPPVTYSLYQLNGVDFIKIDSSSNRVITTPRKGTYYVTAYKDGCFAKSADIKIDECVVASISNTFNNSHFSLFPNPASNLITISANNLQYDSYNLSIYNSLGQKIFNSEISIQSNTIEKQINVSQFATGIYNLIIKNDKGIIQNLSFEINR